MQLLQPGGILVQSSGKTAYAPCERNVPALDHLLVSWSLVTVGSTNAIGTTTLFLCESRATLRMWKFKSWLESQHRCYVNKHHCIRTGTLKLCKSKTGLCSIIWRPLRWHCILDPKEAIKGADGVFIPVVLQCCKHQVRMPGATDHKGESVSHLNADELTQKIQHFSSACCMHSLLTKGSERTIVNINSSVLTV